MTAKFSRFRIQLIAIAFLLTGINVYAQPEIPVLSSPSDHSVQLQTRPVLYWNPSSGADKYTLQVSVDSLFGTLALVYNDTSITDTSRQVGPLANNRTYYWRVSAKNGDGSSAFSGKWSFTTMPAPAVQTTTIISSFFSTGGRPHGLAWDGEYLWMIDNGPNLYKYDTLGNEIKSISLGGSIDRDISWDGTGLWIGGASGDGGALKIDTNGNRIDSLPVHYSDSSGIEWDGRYFWFGDHGSSYIKKHKKDGSFYLDWKADEITGHPTGISYDGIRLWIGGSGEESYNIIYKYSITSDLIYSFDLNDIGIEADLPSFISLAWDGKSLWYASDNAFEIYRLSVPYYHSAPPVPVLVSPANGEDELDLTLMLKWKTSLDAVTYHLQVSKDPAFSTMIFNDSTITDTWREVGPLEYYTTYYWHVSAKNSGGKSAWSGTFSFITFNDPPSNPSGLIALAGNGQVRLCWDPNSEPDLYKYRIYKDEISPAATLTDSVIGPLPDTFYIDTDVSNGSLYFYRITAVDDAGKESEFSNEVVAVPVIEQGNAVLLDGNDDYIDVSTGNVLDELGSEFTIAGWMYYQSAEIDRAIFGSVSDGEDRRISLRSNAFTVQPDGQGYSEVGMDEPVDTGWHHLAGTYDGSNIRLYVDGILQGTQPVNGMLDPLPTSNCIGCQPGSGWYMNGQLDEICIWNVVLSVEQIRNTIHTPVQANNPGLVALWHFDEPDPCSTAHDASTNMIHGTLMNGASFVESKAMAPFAPEGFGIYAFLDHSVTLKWDANAAFDLRNYNIYRDTLSPASILYNSVYGSPPDTFYTDPDVDFDKTYYYRITAVDSSGNESAFSEQLVLGDIIVDGIKDPFWETANAYIHLGQDEVVWGTVNNDGDCSADLYLAYDSVYLYGYIEVTDDVIGSKADWNWWENDALSLKFDPVPDSIIPVNRGSGEEPNWWDIINIEFTAETGFGDERNGNENTVISRTLTGSGYVIEFAISAPGLFNNNTDPPETLILQEGTQAGFYFEMADQDEESYREAMLAWGHSSVNYNSASNVTQFGSMSFLSGNQIQLSHDNLVMSEDEPYIQVPYIQSDHWLEGNSEYWVYYLYVYANDPQGSDDIDSVWAEGPDGSHYHLYDDATHGDEWPPGDGRYRLNYSCDSPLPTGIYTFYVKDKSENVLNIIDSLTSNLDCPWNLIPVHNSIISEPDFLIDWDEVPGAGGYSVEVHLSSNWEQYWQVGRTPDSTSARYNDNGEGKELIEGEGYYLQVHVGDDRNSSHTRVRIAYMTQGLVVIDGIKDPFWETANAYIHLGQDEVVWGTVNNDGDCSADLYLAYDSIFLYGYIEVTDDVIGSKANWNWWENDALSLKLDPAPDSIIPVNWGSGEEPNWWDIINIEFTAETGFGDERNGNENTVISRTLTGSGYVIEFAISAPGLFNNNTDPPETLTLQEGTQAGFYFEIADQDTETSREGALAWGHSSANFYSGNNVTQYGSMTFLANNQIQLSHDNLVMSVDQPFIQVPHVHANHNFNEYLNEWWDFALYVYVTDPQGLDDIDSVWVEGPDGSHYRLNDDNENCDNYGGDGKYQFCQSFSTPPATGVYHFFVIDKTGNTVSLADTLTGLLDCPGNLIPVNNSIISEPDFLIDWDEVPGATGYWINVNLSSNWENIWNINLDPDSTSVRYNENGQGKELTGGDVCILQVNAGNSRYWSQTRVRIAYMTQGFIIIDGIKDSSWDTATAHIHLGPDELVGGEVDNDNDCSADLYLAYDNNFLYGFVEVKDDSVSSKADWNWWENDALSLKLDPVTDSIIPVNWGSSEEPNWWDIINIEFTAETGFGDERNGNENTIISRALTDNGYVIEFAVSAAGLVNNNADPSETVLLQEGTQLGFYFEMADQDEESYREAMLAWGHSSVNHNSASNVTQYGSMTFLANNQIQLSHDNLVMSENQPYIQVPYIQSDHWLEGNSNEWWNYYLYVYANDPQGSDDIDSVWAEGPDGSHYRLYDDATNGDDWPPGDGKYRLNFSCDSPLPTGEYTFYVKDKSGNLLAISDSLTSNLECPLNLIPVHNSIISEPDFLIEWDEVPGATGYWINVNLSSNWEQFWGISLDSTGTSVTYNENGSGEDLIEGEVYYLEVHAGDGRNSSHTKIKIAYMIQSSIVIDGIKDPYWDIATAHIHLGEDELVEGKADDDNDCSADLYLAYDSVYLYGYVEVKDDVVGSKAEGYWWDNDAISLKFDTYPDSIIPVPYNSGEEPNRRDIVNIDITAETGFGDERNGNENTIISRALTDSGYVIEFAISAAGLINSRTDPPENILLQEGTQLGFYFEMADQDAESYREGILAWGHSSANINSGWNVTQFGSMTFLADNQILLSRDNLVMSENQPYIQVPRVQVNHNIDEYSNEWWDSYFYVYANDPQGLNNIDSVWIEGPDGSHYWLYDNNENGDDYGGDGRYCFSRSISAPPATGIYHFFAIDQIGNTVSVTDTLSGLLDCPGNVIPAGNMFITEPDFLIDWDDVPGAAWYWVSINLATDWDNYWSIGLSQDQTSIHYNENGEGRELVEGEIYYLTVGAGNDRNWSQTLIKFSYASQGLIMIDGIKDPFWDTATGLIHLGEDEVVWGDIDDEDDCSTDVYLAYDSLFLYGLIEVTDDVMGPEYDWWWDNDAFAFRFDIDPATLAAEQDASDIFSLEFTARSDAHDRRDGNNHTLLSRNITGNGYILEFAVSAKGLINTGPVPDEALALKEGTQVGFLFQMADEDSVRGREAELAWGHYSVNINSGDNVAQYGSMTLLADNQIQLSQDNLVMGEYQPYIQIAGFSSNHYSDAYLNEGWDLNFSVYVNDPQGLDDIDSVWVEDPDGSLYDLSDDTDGGGYPGDGTYTYGNSFDTPFAVGDYHFNVIDKSGNINSITDSLPGFLDCPWNIIPANNSIISDPELLIEWDEVPGADNYWIDVSSSNGEYFWDFWNIEYDSGRIIVEYNEDGRGRDFTPGGVYYVSVSAGYGRTSSYRTVKFTYRLNDRRTIYVNSTNTSGLEYGTRDFPFNTIQEGINATITGDTVLVFPGTYIENINISNKDIVLGSLFLMTGDTSFITRTLIDGNQNGSVLSVGDCQDTIEINGFTITNGRDDHGGGFFIDNSKPTILKNLVIDNNTGNSSAGAIYIHETSKLVIIDNSRICNNYNGAVRVYDPQRENKTIIKNTIFENNILGCTFDGSPGELSFINTLFIKNTGTEVININNSKGKIINSTIADNTDGEIYVDSTIEVRNCILWNNGGYNIGSNYNIQYSLIEGGADGTGNIDEYPLFVDADAGDYRLKVASHCINMGTQDTTGLSLPSTDLAGNPRIFDGRIDMGAYEYSEEVIALIQFADTVITIDGEITENIWQRSDKYHINKQFTGEVFDGSDDLSAYWKAAWDEDGMYFLVEITADDTLVTDGTYGEVYEQDRINIYLDMNTDNLEDGNGPSTGIDAGNPTNGHYQFSFNRRAEFATLQEWQTGCEIAIIEDEEDATSIQELFIPWSLITDEKGNEFVPGENISIGFDVYVADNDGPDNGEARNRMVWVYNGTDGGYARDNMDNCGKIQLIWQPDETPSIKVSASSLTICPGEEVRLNVIPDDTTGTYHYTWTSDKPGPAYSFRNPVVSPTVTTTYYVSVTDLTNSTTDSVTITVLPLPVVDAGADTSISYNTAVTLSGSVSGGSGFYSYNWSPADSFNYSFVQNPTTHRLRKSNLFTLSAMDYQTGCTNTDQVLVIVTGGTLDASISVSRDTICPGDSLRLLAIPTGGTGDYSYSWTSDPEGFISSLAGPSDVPAGNMTYYVLISDSINSDFATKKIVIHSVVEPEAANVSICYGQPTLPLTALGADITWYDNNTLNTIINTGDTLWTGLSSAGEYFYYVTQTDKNCVSPTAEVSLRIIELPEVIVNLSETVIESGETVQIIAGGADNYLWAPSDGLDRTFGDTVRASPEENTIYTVTGTNIPGCSNTAEITVNVFCEACGLEQVLFDTSGMISYCSLNQSYPDNADCSWLIYPSGALSIYLAFDTIDIKPGDYIRVYNGFNETSELLGAFNNDQLPAGQIQSGSILFIRFQSNTGGTGLGFRARYRANKPVAIEKNEFISGLNIYPNPVSGLLNIEFTSPEEMRLTISVFNTLLQSLKNKSLQVMAGENHEVLDLTGLHPGVYYLQISSKRGSIVRKIVVR